MGCSGSLLLVVLLGYFVGGPAAGIAALICFLGLAILFDNHTGSLLMLAILFLVVVGILALLMTLIAVTG